MPGAHTSSLNIAAAKVVKQAPGELYFVSVIVAGSAAGSVNDCKTTGAAGPSNQVAVIPNTVGVYVIGATDGGWPMLQGIVVVPGTGQTVSVAHS